jgi:hypothetical protein
MTNLQIDLLPACDSGISQSHRTFSSLRGVSAVSPDPRAEELADLAVSADEDNAECATADLFREYGGTFDTGHA